MSEKKITPVFLTMEVAQLAVDQVLSVIESLGDSVLSRMMCHIVILVPSMKDDREGGYPDYPNYQIEPHILYQLSFGKRANWPHEFDSIARCKALQLWQGRNDDRTDCMPHLLFAGDTPYWGGAKQDGIVVACSGFQPHFDRTFSQMILAMCVGLAYDGLAKFQKDGFDKDFLPEKTT